MEDVKYFKYFNATQTEPTFPHFDFPCESVVFVCLCVTCGSSVCPVRGRWSSSLWPSVSPSRTTSPTSPTCRRHRQTRKTKARQRKGKATKTEGERRIFRTVNQRLKGVYTRLPPVEAEVNHSVTRGNLMLRVVLSQLCWCAGAGWNLHVSKLWKARFILTGFSTHPFTSSQLYHFNK